MAEPEVLSSQMGVENATLRAKVLLELPRAAALLILRIPPAKVRLLPLPPKVFAPESVTAPELLLFPMVRLKFPLMTPPTVILSGVVRTNDVNSGKLP